MIMNDASYATHGAARIRPPRSVPATCEESVKLRSQERGPPRSSRTVSGELRLPMYERERERALFRNVPQRTGMVLCGSFPASHKISAAD